MSLPGAEYRHFCSVYLVNTHFSENSKIRSETRDISTCTIIPPGPPLASDVQIGTAFDHCQPRPEWSVGGGGIRHHHHLFLNIRDLLLTMASAAVDLSVGAIDLSRGPSANTNIRLFLSVYLVNTPFSLQPMSQPASEYRHFCSVYLVNTNFFGRLMDSVWYTRHASHNPIPTKWAALFYELQRRTENRADGCKYGRKIKVCGTKSNCLM